MLVRDCATKSFFVHVHNENASNSTRNISLVIKVDHTKVRLTWNEPEQAWTLLVGRRHEQKLPYIKLGVLSVLRDGHGVKVLTNIGQLVTVNSITQLTGSLGVKVFWHDVNNVVIAVPSKYRSKVCGLCGNYNGHAADDALTKRGRAVDNVDRLFNSWKVSTITQQITHSSSTKTHKTGY